MKIKKLIMRFLFSISKYVDFFLEPMVSQKGINIQIQKLFLLPYALQEKSKIFSPIFVVGCPHSGTSVMLAILDNHQNIIAVTMETKVFYKTSLEKILIFRDWSKMTILAGKQRWAEKTPYHIEKINEILRYYPDARIILMLRDGRDVACSIKYRVNDFEFGVDEWLKWNRFGESFWSNKKVMVVKYESVVKHTHNSLSKIFAFLGEPYEAEMSELGNKSRRWYSENIEKPSSRAREHHNDFRNWQINQPLFDGSGKWILSMTDDERMLFKTKAGDLLLKYGYVNDNNW
ncbi:MAG: sulfotransferase [bacterium]